MKEITVTVGVSGSGKSTWAHEQWEKDPMNTLVVNRDKIRELLFGYNEKTISEYYKRLDINKLEKQVTKYEDTLIYEGLNENKHIIVDATHLKDSYLERYKFWNVHFKVKFFDIDLDEAIKRDGERVRQVGAEIIKKQYANYKSMRLSSLAGVGYRKLDNINQDETLPPVYLLDIDGTIAHMNGKRSAYDWKNVGVDDLCPALSPVIDSINRLKYVKVIVVSGRDGVCEPETLKWLSDNNVDFEEFYMRTPNDMRPDWQIKEEIWREISKEYNILALFDDRMQVVRRARALGLKVFQVDYNNF